MRRWWEVPSHTMAQRAIARFRQDSVAADSLEELKYMAKYGRFKQRLIARCACRCCEERLDDAWGRIGLISEGLGDFEAGLVAAHYLFGEPWSEVADEANISVYQAKWRAYEALGWLEKEIEREEGTAGSVQAGRGGTPPNEGD